MPTKPDAIISELIGNRTNLGPTGLQDAHIIGAAFYREDDLAWLRITVDLACELR